MKEYLVSSCLCGIKCRYDGSAKTNKYVLSLVKEGRAHPMCPEVLGGLKTPREESEIKIVNDEIKVLTKSGKDVTKNFNDGALKVLKYCKKHNIKKAILKDKSPSCGLNTYDGSFCGVLTNRKGITAKLLIDNGIKVISEKECERK